MYTPDTHYNTRALSLQEKREILRDAYTHRTHFHVDVLDCRVSVCRVKVDMSFEGIMDMFDDSCHFVIIHRRGHAATELDPWYIEIGFSTKGDPSYVLWLHVEQGFMAQVVKSTGVTPM